jgi:hypothetical protein
MREQVVILSREVRKKGTELLKALNAISPPDNIALAHGRFATCIQTQVADADRAGKLARGEMLADPDYPPACQMFSSAEEEIREYMAHP